MGLFTNRATLRVKDLWYYIIQLLPSSRDCLTWQLPNYLWSIGASISEKHRKAMKLRHIPYVIAVNKLVFTITEMNFLNFFHMLRHACLGTWPR